MKKLISTFVFIIISPLVILIFGQSKEFDVEERPPERFQVIDEKSALIMIYSELDLTFPNYDRFETAPLEEKKSSLPYEYRLLIKAEQKTIKLRVAANGFIPKTIEINDITPKKTITLRIFEKRQVILDKGQFYLATEPPGAKITIDGLPHFSYFTPYTFKDMTATGYKIILTKQDYYDLDTIIIIDKNKAGELKVKLRAKFGMLKLNTHPANELLINDNSYNHNDPIQIPEGNHLVTVRRKYFKDYTERINVVGQFEPMVIEKRVELEPYKGTIEIASEPKGAEVILNGAKIGTTPIKSTINAGYYTLEVKKENFRTEKLNFEILNEEFITKSIELRKNGIVKIVGIRNTKITLDEKYRGLIGNDLKDEFELPPGRYNIKAELEGYDTREFSFDLNSEVKTIDVSLTETFGRFFRFTGFGNSRIANIHNGVGFSVGYFKTELSEVIMFNLTGIKSKYSASGASFQGTLNFIPFSINAGCHISFSGEGLGYSNTGKDSLMDNYYFVNVGWTPFILWELITPSIGVAFNQAVITYGIENESKNDVSYNSFGLYYELKINTSVVNRGGLTLKAGYQDLFDKKAISSFWFIDFGIYWIL